MAATSATVPLSSSSAFLDRKPPRSVSSLSLPPLPIPCRNRPQNRESWKTTAYCRRIARNVVVMATGGTPAEAGDNVPDVVKTVQEIWDKLEDKYAVTSLGFAVIVVLWGSTGMISAIDRLPLVPGLLELVGIGYTGKKMVIFFSVFFALPCITINISDCWKSGTIRMISWFAYRNLIFKPDREALIEKIKDNYNEIIGSR